MFNEGSSTYWSTTNGSYSGSALSYIPEQVWDESDPSAGLSAGGGGASIFFTKPAWQQGTGVPADSSRDVPDLAFNAAAGHDPYLVCQGGFCTNGFRNSANNLDAYGGTSISTPAFAAIVALLEQKIQTKVGLANPTIYALANSTYYTNVFHDVTSGTNDSPCTLGTTNCTTAITPCAGVTNSVSGTNYGCIGYSATAGYDLATGWGSLDVFNFVNDWSLVTPIGVGTISMATSATHVSATPSSVTAGASVTINASVSSATSGVTTSPTGTAQLTVDGTAVGSAVTLNSSAASFTYDTTSLSSGAHTLGVIYSGDSTYVGSKGTTTVDVTTTAADFALSPSSATATTTSGGTASGITFTVSPTSGFTGSVGFTASTQSSTLDATYSFSVNPVTISGTTPGSTVFTLVAAESNATSGLTGRHRLGKGASSRLYPTMPWTLPATGIALAGMLVLFVPRRRNRWTALVLALASIGVLGASGCGSGTSNSTSSTTTTASGTYTITITASGTNVAGTALSHSSTVTFVVQ